MTDYENCYLNNTENLNLKANDKNVPISDLTNDSTMISDMSSMDVSRLNQSNVYKQINKEEAIKECDLEDENTEYELSDELRQEIENKVDQQFEAKYKEMAEYYDNKIYDLLCEQEKVFGKSEMIKAKIGTLETYIKNYCKINGLDYNELIASNEK